MASDQYRVLVVDDEPAIRQLSANALRNQGFECDMANDGEQAAQMAASSRYDVVVTDLKMPNRNGHAFATDILRQPNRPLVVVHTGVMEPKLANDLLLRGVDDLIFKPTDFRVLATKVKSLVERAVRSNDEKANSARQSPEPLQHVVVDEEAADRPVSLSQLNYKLAEISTVLPVSNAALDVYEMTHGDNWEIPQIAAAIQRDASLTTEVLRLANSSFYNASGRRIICLEEALLRIGQQRVGELALSANVLAALTPDLLPWMDLELTWKRSIAAGIAIESLIERGGHEAIEEGLLLSAIMHPLGRVVLGILFPNHYGTMTEQCKRTGEPLREQERQMFPTNHPEIMAHLLASWRISSDVFAPLKY
ncbi:MAG: HDOD domain-containing protein, partial [Pirellulales bacterium]